MSKAGKKSSRKVAQSQVPERRPDAKEPKTDVQPENARELLLSVVTGRFFFETWHQLDVERDARPVRGIDRDATVALVVATVSLVVMEYWGGPVGMMAALDWWDGMRGNAISTKEAFVADGVWEFAKLAYWCGVRVLGFFFVPLAVMAVRDQPIREQNLATRGLGQHAPIYIVALLLVFVCVIAVSFTPEFTTYYPFYPDAQRSWADLIGWELVYLPQFFALEFFFRGYLLQQCRRSMGSLAIFVSAIPYVMVHFGKPMSETLGALGAGIFLGTLAMKTRSIWLGFAVHVGIALSMDIVSLVQKSSIPTSFWPIPGVGP